MNTLLRGRFVICFAALTVVSSVAMAAEKIPIQRPLPQAPQDEPRFKVGSTLVVAAENANLMVGSAVLATLSKGHRIVIVDVRDTWIGAYAAVNGQRIAGWIDTANFVPTNNLAQAETPIFRESGLVVSEPAPKTVRVVAPPAAYNSRSQYYSDHDIGYYVRHETDPNVHVWEPWNR
jgi:hypothetical protein